MPFKMRRPAILSYSKRLAASYVLDWFIIFAFAFIGLALNFVEPYMRPFSLLDLTIAYPLVPETISANQAAFICGFGPAAIIALVVLFFVPGFAFAKANDRATLWRIKAWELEKGLAGLGLGLALAFFVTQGMKNLVGKPRPDMLDRCQPDLDNIREHVIGGYGQDISIRWTLVSASICTNTDTHVLRDGFRSWPSGHSSFSWAGMLYLTLFLCSKFAIAIPFFPDRTTAQVTGMKRSDDHQLLPLHNSNNTRDSIDNPADTADKIPDSPATVATSSPLPLRNHAATPPNHLLVIALFPIAVAVYICATRFFEFYHFGFDIISGSVIGIVSSWFSFRWYHAPIRNGAGWAWGARSRDRAFGIGVGTRTYVGEEGWLSASAQGSNEGGVRY